MLMCCLCYVGLAVAGFGVDPALRISVFQDFSPGEQHEGVSQVQGFSDESRAFLFQGNTKAYVVCCSLHAFFHCTLNCPGMHGF